MNKPNENGGRRRSTMSFRVSKSQREKIENLAAQCGMNRSEYLLSRAYGYKPKTRLTFAQTNYTKYTSMLNAMPQHERMAMFRNQPWMTEALVRLHRTSELITDIINRYFSPNRVPGTSSETYKEQEPTW